MEAPRETGEIFSDLMDEAVDKTAWNRMMAEKMLEKANEVEYNASIVADKYRELAASLILEAQYHADNISDLLLAEFPMFDPNEDGEDDG